MAIRTINNAGLAQGFGVLADAIAGPGPQALINADLARRKGVLTDAQTASERVEAAQMQQAVDARAGLMDLMADPSVYSDPAARAQIGAFMAGLGEDGLEHGPGFMTGAATFANPNAFGDDLSNVLIGTGVVDQWGHTPTGHGAGLRNDRRLEMMDQRGQTERTVLDNEAEMDRQNAQNAFDAANPGVGKSFTPPLVDQNDVLAIWEDMAAIIDQQFPGAAVDPDTQQALTSRATEIYQHTKNHQLAVTQALDEFDLMLDGQQDAWGPFGLGGNPGTVESTFIPQGVERTGGSAPAAQPTQPAADVPDHVGEPVQPPDGFQPVFDEQAGTYKIVQGGKSIPIRDGQTATSPSTGIKLVFHNGQWHRFAG